jgi:protocatechuate 3,4-dioxygenase beta subunit
MEVTNRVVGYRRENADPPYLHPDYKATRVRSPQQPLIPLPHTLSEVTGPVYGDRPVGEPDHDLTQQYEGAPIGERIVLHGRVLDGDGRPVRNTLLEIWQANSATRAATASSRSSPAPTPGATTQTPGAPLTSTSRSSGPPSSPGS